MNKNMLKWSVLIALAGGALSASAQAANGDVYDINFVLTNKSPICAVYDVPNVNSADVNVSVEDSSVEVDGAGKITGFAHLYVDSSAGVSTVMVNVSGSMGMKGDTPVVKMTLKGPGFGTPSTLAGKKANLNAKFIGTPVQTGGESYYYWEMDGKVNGTFNPGIQGEKVVQIKNADAYISSAEGMTTFESCVLTLVNVNRKLAVGGCLDNTDGDLDFHYEWNGSGSAAQNGNFQINMTGTARMTGAKFTLKGQAVDVTPTALSDKNLKSLKATGKVMGQKIDAEGEGSLEAWSSGS